MLRLKKDDSSVAVESETWNVGKSFSATHILVPLINCQRYLDLCNKGVEDIIDINFVLPHVITKTKIYALESFLMELQKLISNTKFVMDKGNLKNLLKIKILLNKVEGDFHLTHYGVEDQRRNQTYYKLNEDIYRKCLNVLIHALEEIKRPLNAKNLIFPSSGIVDLEELKKEIMEMG